MVLLIIPVLFQPAIKDVKSDHCSSPGSPGLDPPLRSSSLEYSACKYTIFHLLQVKIVKSLHSFC